jgi:hypothetical protein
MAKEFDCLFGAVAKDGTSSIEGSNDWTAQKLETGLYEIKFTTPFKALPVVVVNGYIPREYGGAASDNTFCVGPITQQSVTVRTFDVESRTTDNAGKLQDAPFTFMAMATK